MVRVRLLGGLSLEGPDGPLHIPTDVRRLLLVRLAIAERGSVARSRLATDLWPDQPVNKGRRRLSETLSRARSLWGPELIVADSEMLHLTATVDLGAWEAALRKARALPGDLEALQTIRTAYTGSLAPGVVAEWLHPTRDAVEESLEWALGALASALRMAGRPAEAEGVARQLLARAPLRESAVRELLQILALQGRRADGLELFRRFRDRLLLEHGDQPDMATLVIVRELRRQPVLPPPVPAAHRLPLVDREAAVGTLRSLMERAQHGTRTPVAILGPRGSGRTRILEATSRAARWRGFWAIRATSEPFSRAVLASLDMDARERLALAQSPSDPIDAVRAVARTRPTILLLDTDASPSARAAAAQLCEAAWVVHVGTWSHALATVELMPLSVPGVRHLAREITGSDEHAEAVHRWSGGRPALVIDALEGGPPWHSGWLAVARSASMSTDRALAEGWLVQTADGPRPACPALVDTPLDAPSASPPPPLPEGPLPQVLASDLSPVERSQAGVRLAEVLLEQGDTASARSVHRALLHHAGAWPGEVQRHRDGLARVALAEDDPVLASRHLGEWSAPELWQALALANGDAAAVDGPDPDLAATSLARAGRTLAALERARSPYLIAALAADRGDPRRARAALSAAVSPPAWVSAKVLAAEGHLGLARQVLTPDAGSHLEAWSTRVALGDLSSAALDAAETALEASLARRAPAHQASWLGTWRSLAFAIVRHRQRYPAHWPVMPGHCRQSVRDAAGAAVSVVWRPRPHESASERRSVLMELVADATAQGARPTAADYATALGVSPRTVSRDLDTMSLDIVV